VHTLTGDFEEALRHAREGILHNEKHTGRPWPSAPLRVARALVHLGRWAEAREAVTRCNEENRAGVRVDEEFTIPECQVELGWALLGEGDVDGAQRAFSSASGTTASGTAAADAALGQGWVLLARGQLEDAAERFAASGGGGAPERIAEALIGLREAGRLGHRIEPGAQKEWKADADPIARAAADHVRALALAARGRWPEARSREAAAAGTLDAGRDDGSWVRAQAILGVARIDAATGDRDQARQGFHAAVAAIPDVLQHRRAVLFADVLVQASAGLSELGDRDEARGFVDRALTIYRRTPGRPYALPTAHLVRARLGGSKDDARLAAEGFRRAGVAFSRYAGEADALARSDTIPSRP
jgi:tetratricopeptide (TPR) repeat protein